MIEFCKFILSLDGLSWFKLMGTLLILAFFVAGIVEDIGKGFVKEKSKK